MSVFIVEHCEAASFAMPPATWPPPSLLRTVLLAVIVITSLAGRAATFRPVQVLVAALLLALIFLLAEIARLLPGRPAGAVR